MKRTVVALIAMTLLGTPLIAHHSFAMFNMDKDVTIVGTITDVRWQNPHIHFVLRVDPGKGVDPAIAGSWEIEGAAIAIVSRQGWTRTTLKIGDKATIVGRQLKSGEKGMSLFYLIRPDGSRLYQDIARPKEPAK